MLKALVLSSHVPEPRQMKSKVEGEGVLVTEAQQSWIKTQLILRRLRPLKRGKPPGHPLGDWCFRLAQQGWFDVAVMACIILNTIVMAMEYFGQSDIYTTYDMMPDSCRFGVLYDTRYHTWRLSSLCVVGSFFCCDTAHAGGGSLRCATRAIF